MKNLETLINAQQRKEGIFSRACRFIKRKIAPAILYAGMGLSALTGFNGCGKGGGGGTPPDTTPEIICNSDISVDYAWAMKSDGSYLTQVGTQIYTKPKWHPLDKTKIIASRKNAGTGKYYIFTANRDGTTETSIIDNSASWHDYKASYKPDGTKLCFISDRDSGTLYVYTANADGSSQTKLPNQSSGGVKENPVWGADGYIYYETWKINNWEICRAKADGTGTEENLTNTSADEGNVDISHNGTQIVYASLQTGSQQLFTANPNGTNPVQITFGSRAACEPNFSPNGTQIVYGEYVASPESEDLVVIDKDGTNALSITDGARDYFCPDW
jgi:Tol biopolymer transport system component